jgi:hypothetical protein
LWIWNPTQQHQQQQQPPQESDLFHRQPQALVLRIFEYAAPRIACDKGCIYDKDVVHPDEPPPQ